MSQRHALLVLGMHRSGTSALTRLLNLWGAALPTHVMPANGANVAGYWEPTTIVSLHDRLLSDAGSAWDDPTGFPADWFATQAAAHYVEELAAVVGSEFGEAPLIAIKDPRACRLVPIWERVLARLSIAPLAVIVVRHPFEVAASLHRRDGMPHAQGWRLWLEHVLAAEVSTRTMPRAIVTFDQVLHDWVSVRSRFERELGMEFPSAGPVIDSGVAAFLDPQLRHERVPAAPSGDDLHASEWAEAVYRWCKEASEASSRPDGALLDRAREHARQTEAAFVAVIRSTRHREVDLEERLKAIGQQQEDLARQGQAAQAAHEAEIGAWQAEALRWREHLAQLQAREAGLAAEIERARQVEAALRQHIAAIEMSAGWRMQTALKRHRDRVLRLFGR